METKMIRMQEVDSTNTFLKNLKTYDADALTVAVADHQTAGRGQGTHTWESEPGKNLLFSLLTCPTWVPGSPSREGCAGYLYRWHHAEMA